MTATTTFAALNPKELRCEYKTDPLGIGVANPRLSWKLITDDPKTRGQKQTAYEILVASSRENLDADKGDLWSTGKVASDDTAQIPYAGAKLASGARAFWKVRIWSGGENPSAWSEPALWSMALDPKDWKAKWIGYDEPDVDAKTAANDALTLEGCKWIWSNEGNPAESAPKGTRYFRSTIDIPKDKHIASARFMLTADNRFELFINGAKAGRGDDFHRATVVDVAKHLKSGMNDLAIAAKNDSDGPAGLIGRLRVEFDGADPIVVTLDGNWKVSTQDAKYWNTRPLDDNWKPAKEVASVGDKPWGTPSKVQLELPPPPYLRKMFGGARKVSRATLYASALGVFELHLNGQRVGEDVLAPGWTDYKKRVHYMTYDVTPLVREGENVLGAILGDGWYAGYFSYQGKRHLYGDKPRLIAQLEIEYADGSKQTIVSDESWKAAYGPIREADLLQGSAYDAHREITGWDSTGFDDSKWQAVVTSDAPSIKFEPHPGVPVRKENELPAKAITEPVPGVYVFDLGQNMVGWTRLKVRDEKSPKITLRHSEMLNPDGTLYLTSLRGARAMDQYIPKGAAEETWEPEFTFHGFRYVEVSGLSKKPDLDMITGIVVHSDMEPTGSFECSNPLVNQLVHNIIWGQKGNYLEIPTDCPQRDERLGWTGDAQFFVRTGAYNFDVSAFFTKWLVDLIDDSQHEDGSFADVAPDVLGGHGNTAWQDAGIVCPYTIYKVYGDTRIIEQHYAAMQKYADYLQKTSKELVRGQGAYGDWVNLGGGAKPEVVGTAYFEYVTRLMSEMAGAIGKKDDAAKYLKLSDDIRAAFVKSFVEPDGKIKESSQTGYALAFTMNLLPDDIRKKSADAFVEEIKKKDWHLATGFIGTPRLLPALTRAGRNDVAYRLLLTETFPSWLFQVKLGATTMWERWDGWVPGKGFQDPGMNSFNHYAFGSVGEWIYGTVAGIETDGPGFKKITIKPHIGEGLTHASAKYNSIRGEIESSWKIDGGKLTLNLTVPPNTTATVYVPAADEKAVKESRDMQSVKFERMENGAAVFSVESGKYEFTVAK